MRTIIVLALTLVSLNANAGARLSLQASQFDGKDGVHPMVGLSVDQKLVKMLFVNGWVGAGSRPVHDDTKRWGSGKVGIDMRFPLVSFGIGAFANTGASEMEELGDQGIETGGYVKVSLKLW